MSAALALINTPAHAIQTAPTAIQDPTGTQCWEGITRKNNAAGEEWLDEHPANAATIALSALEIALTCGTADAERSQLVFKVLNTTLVVFGDFIQPTEPQIRAIHTWYSHFADNPPTNVDMAALTAKYRSFSGAHPPPTPPLDPRVSTAQPIKEGDEGLQFGGADKQKHDKGLQTGGVDKQKRDKGMQIGGVSLLVLGTGSMAAGFVTLSRIGAQNRALAEMCTPVCTMAADAAPLIRRGELYEGLTPALLTIGGVLAITGGVLMGIGIKRRNKQLLTALAPVITPRFAGASWTFRF